MLKKLHSKLIILLLISSLISVSLLASPTFGLISQNSTSWFTNSDTNSSVVAIGDVNNDGVNEIVSGGYFNDGANWDGQLTVLNSATLATTASTFWRLGSITNVEALAIGDVNGDGKMEIVTVGTYFDGTFWIGQMIVWNGTTLATLGAHELAAWPGNNRECCNCG